MPRHFLMTTLAPDVLSADAYPLVAEWLKPRLAKVPVDKAIRTKALAEWAWPASKASTAIEKDTRKRLFACLKALATGLLADYTSKAAVAVPVGMSQALGYPTLWHCARPVMRTITEAKAFLEANGYAVNPVATTSTDGPCDGM